MDILVNKSRMFYSSNSFKTFYIPNSIYTQSFKSILLNSLLIDRKFRYTLRNRVILRRVLLLSVELSSRFVCF